jgi:uncharacterized caspase-like protein
MQLFRNLAVAALALIALAAGQGAHAAERRLALVIGESAYPAKPIATAANDAGLVAQTLQAAGFDVTGARDLDEAALRQSFRDFLDKAAAAGPDAVVFVYVSGYGLQLEGENYIVPVDAKLARDADLPLRALRVSDYLKPLAASGAKLSVVALDAARANPFQLAGQPLAGGLALFEPGGRTLLAFNAAPGTIAPEAAGDYGPYAHALAEMIRDGGLPLMQLFDNTRLRVSELTKGAQIPWNSQRVETDFVFFQREANAPPRVDEAARLAQPIGALGPDDGFTAALRRDTMRDYEDYVAAYPAAAQAKRARAILAARREALTWGRSRALDAPNAYWSYLKRYPKGPHAWDARRRLAEMRDAMEPPPSFEMVDYGWGPPPPDEMIYVEQPVVSFADPMWAFPPPPPPAVWFLPPPPPDFVVLPPPVIIATPYALPAPPFVPIPVWQAPPPYISPPPQNVIYANMHRAVVLEPQADAVVIRDPVGGAVSRETMTAVGVGAAAMGVGAALPAALVNHNPALRPNAPGMAPPAAIMPAGASVGVPAPGDVRPSSPAGETHPGALAPGAARPLPGGPATLPGQAPAAAPHLGPSGQGPMTRRSGPGLGHPEHALPTPAEGAAARPGRPDRGGDRLRPGPGADPFSPGAGGPGPTMRPAPLATGGHGPAHDRFNGRPGGPDGTPLGAPVGGFNRGPQPVTGDGLGPDAGPSFRGPPPSRREAPAQRLDSGSGGPFMGRGHGRMNDAPMGDMPPPGMPPQMRGMPHDLMPGGSPPMPAAPHYPGGGAGAPPQMRPPPPQVMPAGPAPGSTRPMGPFPQREAPAHRDHDDGPQHGGGGDHGGFGGPR